MENIAETEEKEDTGKSWDLVQIPKLLSQHDRHILQITRDTEVIQSFVRAGSDTESEDDEPATDRIEVKRFAKKPPSPAPPEAAKAPRTTKGGGGPIDGQDDGKGKEKKQEEGKWSSHAQKATFVQLTRDLKKRRRGRRVRREEVYTDKDRAAAVNLGNKDIKQSLKAKKKMDRCKLLAIPEEADVSSVLAHGEHEMKFGNVEVGFKIINKALELEPEDKNALVARSKCYLMLGQPHLALRDAETVLSMDKKFIRGIYQKAEALYHLGDFEHSLLFYHRGHKIRPELEGFRLGVQKAQEAIENSIGRNVFPERYDQIQLPVTVSSDEQGRESFRMLTRAGTVISEDDEERRTARRLLGELCVDKNYLEQLIRNPDIKVTNKDSGNKISEEAQEAITFLKGRQEFWRQRQKLKQKKK